MTNFHSCVKFICWGHPLCFKLAFDFKNLKGEGDYCLFSSIHDVVTVGPARIVGWKIWRNHSTAGGCEVCSTPCQSQQNYHIWIYHPTRSLNEAAAEFRGWRDGATVMFLTVFQQTWCFQHSNILTGAEGGWESFSCGITALESTCDDVIWCNKWTGGNWATAWWQQSFRMLTLSWPHLQGITKRSVYICFDV